MIRRQHIEEALNRLPALREYDRFQELAFHLAKTKWPGLRLTHKVHDRGADAIDQEQGLVLACGWNGDRGKLISDCKTIKRERPGIRKIAFATSQVVSEAQIKSWGAAVRELEFELVDVIHHAWIVGEILRPEHVWIAHQYLNLPIDDYADLCTHLPKVRNAARKIVDSWRSDYRVLDHPRLDLRIEEVSLTAVGEETTAFEYRQSELAGVIRCGDAIWLTGQPGIGKTHTLISIAESILSLKSRVPVLISLRSWALKGIGLFEYACGQYAFQLQGVLPATLATAVEAGEVVLLLNGWNEIPDSERERLSIELRELLGQSGGATLVISSRNFPTIRQAGTTYRWTVCELNYDEIIDGLRQFRISSPVARADAIVQSVNLHKMAQVPLFLWEIASYIAAAGDIPRTRITLLGGMINRACSEHGDSLTMEDQEGLAPRFLSRLAVKMTENGATGLSADEARQTVARLTEELKSEAIFETPPSPPAILRQLASSHLLVAEDTGDLFRFSHQLVQEYFAAAGLSAEIMDAGASVAIQRVSQSAWELPIELSIQYLCERDFETEAAQLALRLAEENLEAACRSIGLNRSLWPHLQSVVQVLIDALASSEDVNANWLAARCAAATGVDVFADVVYDGLTSYPRGSSDPYSGLDSEVVLNALGERFVGRLIAEEDDSFRVQTLTNLADSGTECGLQIARLLAIQDRSPDVRMCAYDTLFQHGVRGMMHAFVREVHRQGGWNSDFLNIAIACPELPIEHWRRRQERFLCRQDSWKTRWGLFRYWLSNDRRGAYDHVKKEYEWCVSRAKAANGSPPPVGQTIADYRYFCLRWAAKVDEDWTAPRVRAEVQQPGFARFDAIPLELLKQEECDEIALNDISSALGSAARRDQIRHLAIMSPHAVARWILQKVCSTEFRELDLSTRQRMIDALGRVDRSAQLEVASEGAFESPPSAQLEDLVDVLMRAGKPTRQESDLPLDLHRRWRARLLHWAGLLPPLERDTAHIWSDFSTVLSELRDPSDIQFVMNALGKDHIQLSRHRTSHQPIYHQALSRYSGDVAGKRIEILLDDPRDVAFAAHWLATHLGAPVSEQQDFGEHRFRYDFVRDRLSRDPDFAQRAAPILDRLKTQIDRQLTKDPNERCFSMGSALLAVARLEGAAAGPWILDRLEQHAPDGCWEDLLRRAALVGANLSGRRVLPFVVRTIERVLNPEFHPSHDETYRVQDSIIALLLSDEPRLAIEILENQASEVFEHHPSELASLLSVARWVEARAVDDYLEGILGSDGGSPHVLVAAMQVSIDRCEESAPPWGLQKLARILSTNVKLQQSEGSCLIFQRLGEVLERFPDIRSAVIAEATSAETFKGAQRWLRLLAHIGSDDAVFAAFDLTERWSEAKLQVVSSLYPVEQDGSGRAFSGWSAYSRGELRLSPVLRNRLKEMTKSSDDTLRAAAFKALIWIDRERLERV